MIYGYARVSTTHQNTDLQTNALKKYGVDEIIQDHGVSGSKKSRPALDSMLALLRKGDTVVVYKMDRLGRSLSNMIQLAERFKDMGVGFVSITEQFDTRTPAGKLFFHIMCSLGEFERDLRAERQGAGIAAAKARGVKFGVSQKYPRTAVLAMRGDDVRDISKRTGVPVRTVRRILEASS